MGTNPRLATRVAAVARQRDGWRLTLEVPAWGVEVVWSAAPRELDGGRPPAVGRAGHLIAPDDAWSLWPDDAGGEA